MEPPSASPHRGHVPWQGLLLAVLVSPLTFWNLPTTAQLAIESVPFTAAEGTDVLLLAHNVSENVKGYTWYKGERGIDSHQISIYLTATQGIIPGPAYSGRETVYPNGSLLFQKVTLEDTGFYTLQTISSDLQAEKASGHICVYQSVTKPSILASNVSITEEGPVAMTCLSGDTGISITWIFSNQTLQLTDRMQLQEDAGEYQCEVSNPASSTKSDPLKLAEVSSSAGRSKRESTPKTVYLLGKRHSRMSHLNKARDWVSKGAVLLGDVLWSAE
uniref:Carcinoembryonic antigen-related cell adhesion molecule 6-like n=1 Tax=Marmota marmota marmota TaxID=9994 RepID=A0A8C6EV83_MARMA